jgi:hypothetical protein
VVLDLLHVSLEVVLHVFVALLHLFNGCCGGDIAESRVVGGHNLSDVVKLVVEKLVCLSYSRAQLLEGFLKALDVLLVVVIDLVLDLFIEGVKGVHYIFLGDSIPKKLLALLDAP